MMSITVFAKQETDVDNREQLVSRTLESHAYLLNTYEYFKFSLRDSRWLEDKL